MPKSKKAKKKQGGFFKKVANGLINFLKSPWAK